MIEAWKPQPDHCEACGAGNPYLVWNGVTGQWECEHAFACRARIMLAKGASVRAAAKYAQQPRYRR